MEHKHQWELYLAEAWGYFSKREDQFQDDRFWTAGRVSTCKCAAFLFTPHHEDLQEVEGTLVDILRAA